MTEKVKAICRNYVQIFVKRFVLLSLVIFGLSSTVYCLEFETIYGYNVTEVHDIVDVNSDSLPEIFFRASNAAYQKRQFYTCVNGKENPFSYNIQVADEYDDSLEMRGFIADVNCDGYPDFVGYGPHSVKWHKNNGDGRQFTYSGALIDGSSGTSYRGIYPTDFDQDGDIDIILSAGTSNSSGTYCYLNDGTGKFQSSFKVANKSYYVVGAEDLDKDGINEIIYRDSSNYPYSPKNISYFKQNEDKTFNSYRIGGVSGAFVKKENVIDYDKDGDFDLVCMSFKNRNCTINFYKNDGNGSFDHDFNFGRPYFEIDDYCISDINLDGSFDIVISGLDELPSDYKTELYLNDGTNTFKQENTLSNTSYNCVFSADLDLDGDMDILGSSSVFYNKLNPSRFESHNEGRQLRITNSDTIRWSVGASDVISLEYSTNDGVDWTSIANDTDNDGEYIWTVPDKESSECYIRLLTNGVPIDTTGTFSIVKAIRKIKGSKIGAGKHHTVALALDSTLWTWGQNNFGQLGDGTNTDRVRPMQIGERKYLSVAVEEEFAFAIASDSTLWAWGKNHYSQLGDGTTTNRNQPVQIGTRKYLMVACGRRHTLALSSDSTLWGWGHNFYGQLGNGTSGDKSEPIQIGTRKYISVSCGSNHTLALSKDGTLWAWGDDGEGQVGVGGGMSKKDPIQVGTRKYLSIAAGGRHSLALSSDSTLWAWGDNIDGQLGNGSYSDRNRPVQIGDRKYMSIACQFYYSMALASDSTLWTWGRNSGPLGNGSIEDQKRPTQIGDRKYIELGCGYTHALGRSTNETFWIWGDNEYGKLGDGTNIDRDEPIQLLQKLSSFPQELIVGESENIEAHYLSKYGLEYSVNGGSDWTSLGNDMSGVFSWEVPNLVSSQCYVRLLDPDGTHIDTSRMFSIVNGIIDITSFNSGSFVGATTHDITWDGQGAISTVKIEYTTDGSSWETIATGEANDGTYSWTIPDKSSTSCKVRVTSELNPEVTDISDYNFTITPTPKITLTAPNGTESWIYGTSQEISWTNVNLQDQVLIEYSSDSGKNWSVISTVTSGATAGTYNWTIPNDISDKCLVRVSEAGDKIPTDVSDAAFSIAIPTVSMTSPNGGEVWYKGDTHNLTWSSVGTVGNVKLEYTTNGISWQAITLGTQNDGSYSWTVPNVESETCKIRISEVSNAAIVDKSDADFIITTTPQITLTAPNGGEAWTEGTLEDITWQTAGFVGKIKIEYSINNIDWTVIVDSTENDGLFSWDIPRDPTTTAKVRVTDINAPAVTDMSDGNVTLRVKPALAVTAPVGGEEWEVGSTQTISWITEGIVGNVKIEYSADNGTTWKLINPSTINDGTESWTVADDASTDCLIRVYEMGDGDPADTCIDVFEIYEPSLTVKTPNGGETLNVGDLYSITWDSRGTVGNVSIDFRDTINGDWIEIIKGTSNDGAFNWTVPDSGTTTGRIRIYEETRPTVSDNSDNYFTIDGGSLKITKQPISKSVEAGETATFEIGVVGEKPISYQWQKDGVALVGETASLLSLTSVSLADSGLYTCFVSNPYGDVLSQEAKLTVGNKAPVLTKADDQETKEDTPLTLTLDMTDATDDDPLTLIVGTGDNYTLDGTKVIPTENWFGTLLVPVSVTDGKLSSAVVTMSITVDPVNDLPTISSTPGLKAVEQKLWSYTVIASDIESTTLLYSLSGQPAGMVISDNVISWTPAENVTTSGEVTLSVSDSHTPAGVVEQKFTISVSDTNLAPTLTTASTQTTAEDNPITLAVDMTDGTDGDGDALALVVEPGANYTVDGTKVTPLANFHGELTVPVSVTDGLLSSDKVDMKVVVTPVNDAPVLTKVLNQTTKEEEPITITLAMLEATDIDGDELTVVLENPSGCTIDGTTLIPDKDNDFEIAVSVSVSDGLLTSESKLMIIPLQAVNDAPILTEVTAQTVAEDTPLLLTVGMTNATDIDNSVLTVVVGEGDNYTVTGATITPVPNFVGQLTVPVSVSDGDLSSTVMAMSVTVTAVNDAPQLLTVAEQTSVEDVPFTATLDMVTALDVDGDALSLVVCEGAQYTLVGNTITPVINHVGELLVPILVSDGALLSDTLNMAITITPVNDVPLLTTVTPQTVSEDTPLTLSLAMTDASDVDGDALSLVVGSGANYTVDGASITPVANYIGDLTVPVSVTDGIASSAVVNATISVTAHNDAPVLTVVTAQTVAEDTPLALTLAMTDATDIDGDVLTLIVGTGDNYTVDGTTITPAANFNGVLTVPMYVTDGALSSAVVPMSVTVTAVNDAPTVTAATTQTTLENTPLSLMLAMTDASDVDGDALTLIVAPGDNYTVEGTTITPAPNFAGVLSLLLSVSDGVLISATVPMSVTVTSTNVAPILSSVAPLVMVQNTPVTLSENSFVAEDTDGDALTLIIESDGNATVSGMTITPAADFIGAMKLMYSVTDGRLISNKIEQTVIVKAAGTNTPPVLESVSKTEMEKNSTIVFSLDNVIGSDADGDALQIIIGEGTNYTVSGTSITPMAEFLGKIVVPVTLSDGIALSETVTCTVTVFEEIFGIHKGLLEKSFQTKIAVTPNPVPASASAVRFISERSRYDALKVTVYDHIGNVMVDEEAIERGSYFSLVWDLSQYRGSVGGSFVAILTFYKDGEVVSQRTEMIGIKK